MSHPVATFLVAPILPDAVLASIARLPLKPAPVTLTGHIVRLAPLDLERDVAALFVVSNGSVISLGDRQAALTTPTRLSGAICQTDPSPEPPDW